MKKFLLVFLVCLTSLALSAQMLHVVRGVVKIDGTDEPVEGAAVRIAGKGIVTETDGDGAFALEVPTSEKETVVVRAAGFLPVRQVIRVDGDVNLGEISVKPDLYEEMREDMIISLSEAEYDSEDGIISSTQNISGLLTSGGDIFSSKPPFRRRGARFLHIQPDRRPERHGAEQGCRDGHRRGLILVRCIRRRDQYQRPRLGHTQRLKGEPSGF